MCKYLKLNWSKVVKSVFVGVVILGGLGFGLLYLIPASTSATNPPPIGDSLNSQRTAVGGLRLVDPSWHGYTEFNEEK